MSIGLLAPRLLLAGVFGLAGLAKLADRRQTREALANFGLPRAFVHPFALLLPVGELAVAAFLVTTALAWWGAVGALLLLLLFCVGISINLVQGRRPECHCFGQIRSAPVSPATLIRNGLLAVVAALIVWRGRESPGASVLVLIDSQIAIRILGALLASSLLVVLGSMAWLLIHLLRQQGRLLLRIEALERRLGADTRAYDLKIPANGLAIGTPAPEFELRDVSGDLVSLKGLRAKGTPLVLVFSDPECGACTALLPSLSRWQREYHDRTIAVVSRGPQRRHQAYVQNGLKNVLLQKDGEVARMYRAHSTPAAVVVWPDGVIGSRVVTGAEGIEILFRNLGGTNRTPPSVGEAAPEFQLHSPDGRTVSLADFMGRATLILFWQPQCGFCLEMLDAVKAWETNRPDNAPELLVISTGSAEANRAMGFRSTILLDQGLGVAASFGVRGTPAGILVDAGGRIASPISIGNSEVLRLFGVALP